MERSLQGEVEQVIRHDPSIYIAVTICCVLFGVAIYGTPVTTFSVAFSFDILCSCMLWMRWFLNRVEITRTHLCYVAWKRHSLPLDEVRRIEASYSEIGRSIILVFNTDKDKPAFSIPKSFFGDRLDSLPIYFAENYPNVEIVGFSPIKENSMLFGQGLVLCVAGLFLMAIGPHAFPHPAPLAIRWLVVVLIVSGYVRFAQTMRGPGLGDIELANAIEEIPDVSDTQPPH